MICRKPLYIPIETYNSLPKETKALITKLTHEGCLAYATRCVEYDPNCNCIKYGTGYFLTNPDTGSFELPIRHYTVSYEMRDEDKATLCVETKDKRICVDADLTKPAHMEEELRKQGIDIDYSDTRYITRVIKTETAQWEHHCNGITKILEHLS